MPADSREFTPRDGWRRSMLGKAVQLKERDIRRGHIPRWLDSLKVDVSAARKRAGLPPRMLPQLLALMAGLYEQLGRAPPMSASERRAELKRHTTGAKAFKAMLEGMSDEIAVLLDMDPVVDKLIAGLDDFITHTSNVQIPPEPGGRTPHLSSMCAGYLVYICRDARPLIKKSEVANLAQAILDPVLIRHSKKSAGGDGLPDWHDRVSAEWKFFRPNRPRNRA